MFLFLISYQLNPCLDGCLVIDHLDYVSATKLQLIIENNHIVSGSKSKLARSACLCAFHRLSCPLFQIDVWKRSRHIGLPGTLGSVGHKAAKMYVR